MKAVVKNSHLVYRFVVCGDLLICICFLREMPLRSLELDSRSFGYLLFPTGLVTVFLD